jgi:hypothetical protein
VLAKFLVAFLPTLLMGWGFMSAISVVQGTNLPLLLFELAVVALTIAGATGLNLAFGVAGVNLAWEDPRQMIRGSIGCLGSLVSLAYLLIDLGLFFGPPIVVVMLNGPEAAGQILGLALGGLFSLLCAIVPPWLVHHRIARLGEN